MLQQPSSCGKRLNIRAQRKAYNISTTHIKVVLPLKWKGKEACFKENKESGFIVFKELFC